MGCDQKAAYICEDVRSEDVFFPLANGAFSDAYIMHDKYGVQVGVRAYAAKGCEAMR
jgi:hypothetical protein